MYKQEKIQSLIDIKNFAIRFTKNISSKDIILLKGDLGTGKTTFARIIIQFYCGEHTVVNSPTFSFVQKYTNLNLRISHFDLYKLKEPYQAKELNIEESFINDISIIEWPEKLGCLVPKRAHILEFIKIADINTRYI